MVTIGPGDPMRRIIFVVSDPYTSVRDFMSGRGSVVPLGDKWPG